MGDFPLRAEQRIQGPVTSAFITRAPHELRTRRDGGVAAAERSADAAAGAQAPHSTHFEADCTRASAVASTHSSSIHAVQHPRIHASSLRISLGRPARVRPSNALSPATAQRVAPRRPASSTGSADQRGPARIPAAAGRALAEPIPRRSIHWAAQRRTHGA